MKKIFNIGVVLLALCLLVTGCGSKNETTSEKKSDSSKTESKKEESKTNDSELDMSVSHIIAKVYDGIEDMPKLGEMPVDAENLSYYMGEGSIAIKEGIASEPMMGSIAWSVVVIEVEDDVDVEQAKKDIKEKVDPRKWICVEASKVSVVSRGNKIMLIMMGEEFEDNVKIIEDNFNNLK